jgi:capreomycidine synthase
MQPAPALLEHWMREYYFDTEIDIGSSGVRNFSFGEIRSLLRMTSEELDAVVFQDSTTLGEPGLRTAIAERWGNGDPDCVMITHGSSEAIYLIINALVQPGDKMIVLDPSYQQLFSIAESLGCELKRWRLHFNQEYRPDITELKRLLCPQTRAVVVNFPHNPTGASISIDEQKELISTVSRVGSYLVWDAAFADITYKRAPLPYPNLQYERSISIGTLSKSYGLPGLRVGWIIGPPDILNRCAHLRDYITLHLSPLTEFIALRVIRGADTLLSSRLAEARQNLSILERWVSDHQSIVKWAPPEGGVCALPQLCSVSDVEAFCRHLAKAHSVLLVPGTCFNRSEHVRLGFGSSSKNLNEGLTRLSAALKEAAY